MPEDRNPEQAIEATLSKNDLVNISKDLLENTTDAFTDNELIKSIPIFNYLLNSVKGILSIREYFFTRKIIRFLLKLKDTSNEERDRFVERINSDKDERKKVGNVVIGLVERLEDEFKADILGFIFKEMISGTMEYRKGLKLAHIITFAHEGDLETFARMGKDWRKDQNLSDNLVGWGCITLIEAGAVLLGPESEMPALMKLNSVGLLLQNTLIDFYKEEGIIS